MAITDSGEPFMQTATNATSAVATQTGVAAAGQSGSTSAIPAKTYYITSVSGSSDKSTALILIKDGTTVIWQDRISNTSIAMYFFPTPLKCTKGASCSATVDGTAMCNANIAGVAISAP